MRQGVAGAARPRIWMSPPPLTQVSCAAGLVEDAGRRLDGPALHETRGVQGALGDNAEPAVADARGVCAQEEDFEDFGRAVLASDLATAEAADAAVGAVGGEHFVDPVEVVHRLVERTADSRGGLVPDVEGEDAAHDVFDVAETGGGVRHGLGPGRSGGTGRIPGSCSWRRKPRRCGRSGP